MIAAPRSPIITPQRPPIWTPERERKRRRDASFITSQPTQHRDRNLFIAGTGGGATPDPFFPAVLYLFDGTLTGTGRLFDASQYAGEYSNPGNRYTSVADSPVGGFSLRRDMTNANVNQTVQLAGGPTGAVQIDPDTWTVEFWFKNSAGADVAGTWITAAEVRTLGLGDNTCALTRDVFPIIYRFTGYNNPNVLPALTAPNNNIGSNPPGYYVDTWLFYAMVCSNGNMAQWINGARQYFVAHAPVGGTAAFQSMGTLLADSSSAGGTRHYTQLRYTNGVARYDPTSGAIPVPTAPFPTFGP